jgi:hypothetical protein
MVVHGSTGERFSLLDRQRVDADPDPDPTFCFDAGGSGSGPHFRTRSNFIYLMRETT